MPDNPIIKAWEEAKPYEKEAFFSYLIKRCGAAHLHWHIVTEISKMGREDDKTKMA